MSVAVLIPISVPLFRIRLYDAVIGMRGRLGSAHHTATAALGREEKKKT